MNINGKHVRDAAEIMSDLLCSTLTEAERSGRQMYDWEVKAIMWLQRQMHTDKETQINAWVYRKIDEANTLLDNR